MNHFEELQRAEVYSKMLEDFSLLGFSGDLVVISGLALLIALAVFFVAGRLEQNKKGGGK